MVFLNYTRFPLTIRLPLFPGLEVQMPESRLVRNLDEPHGYGKSHPGWSGRSGVKENGVFVLSEKGDVGVAIDHDLSRVLMKENLSFLVESKPRHREMESTEGQDDGKPPDGCGGRQTQATWDRSDRCFPGHRPPG